MQPKGRWAEMQNIEPNHATDDPLLRTSNHPSATLGSGRSGPSPSGVIVTHLVLWMGSNYAPVSPTEHSISLTEHSISLTRCLVSGEESYH
jgi:hypothetical protein